MSLAILELTGATMADLRIAAIGNGSMSLMSPTSLLWSNSPACPYAGVIICLVLSHHLAYHIYCMQPYTTFSRHHKSHIASLPPPALMHAHKHALGMHRLLTAITSPGGTNYTPPRTRWMSCKRYISAMFTHSLFITLTQKPNEHGLPSTTSWARRRHVLVCFLSCKVCSFFSKIYAPGPLITTMAIVVVFEKIPTHILAGSEGLYGY